MTGGGERGEEGSRRGGGDCTSTIPKKIFELMKTCAFLHQLEKYVNFLDGKGEHHRCNMFLKVGFCSKIVLFLTIPGVVAVGECFAAWPKYENVPEKQLSGRLQAAEACLHF